ncbi:uncharacterized protein LAESUDRAFT_301744 [Laetiporus sulphureus 93-53]|uniref:Uncharacterized protein n=1 Tax=Laetiporus sulphureus 93-53 TaxID=1314785 RepID=A0A165D7E8_9APHY|nr:uncharacterized protein LAESUDRAFT_301744 [Laetiporus sulphureus 93-53]KZT04275.1 hypothetical protein LAESUDRAFT_301744 [Laetiporus sulphureus 93-53]
MGSAASKSTPGTHTRDLASPSRFRHEDDSDSKGRNVKKHDELRATVVFDLTTGSVPHKFTLPTLIFEDDPLIRRVPAEILQRVFRFYVHDDTTQQPHLRRVVCVAAVSRTWRCIVHSCAELWTTIVVLTDEKPPIFLVSDALKRSGDKLLDIRINLRHMGMRSSLTSAQMASYCRQLISLLSEHQMRWRTFLISCELLTIPGSRTIVLKGPLKNLLHFECTFDFSPLGSQGNGAVIPQLIDFTDVSAPNLRTLTIRVPAQACPTITNFEQRFPRVKDLDINLSSLHAGQRNDGAFRKTMQGLPHVRHLALRKCEPHDFVPSSVIVLSGMERLSLQSVTSNTMGKWLDNITAPQLVSLTLCVTNGFGNTTLQNAATFRERLPSLRTLEIIIHPSYANIFYQYGVLSVSLSTVTFSIHGVTQHRAAARINELLKMMALIRDDRRCFSRVVRLYVHVSHSKELKSLLHQLVLERTLRREFPVPCAKLEEIHVCTHAELPRQDREWFQEKLKHFTWSRNAQNVLDLEPNSCRLVNCA